MTNEFLRYLQYERRYSSHTLRAYKSDLSQFEKFLHAAYPETPLPQVNKSIVRDWIISLAGDDLEESSINRKIVTLKSFFGFLLKQGKIKKSPLTNISSLKTKKSIPQFVRMNDMDRVLDGDFYDDNFYGVRDCLVVEVLYGTGIRLSELINLKEQDVGYVESTIKVLGKRNKERIIPVSSSLLELIKKYIFKKNDQFEGNASEYLIVSNKGVKTYPMMINRIVKKYLKETAVDKKSPHVLRHTYATHLLDNGADLNAVKELLGHQSLAATQIYTHNSLGKLKKVFDQAHPKA